MKKVALIILGFIFFNCSPYHYEPQKEAKSDYFKITDSLSYNKIIIKNNILGDSIYLLFYFAVLNQKSELIIRKDTVLSFSDEISYLNIKIQNYKREKSIWNTTNKSILLDIIEIKKNWDSLDYSDELLQNEKIRKKDSIKSVNDSVSFAKKQDRIERARYVLADGIEQIEYYHKKIDKKSQTYIADFLYNEGFGRDYDISGSVFYTIYKASWTYENGDYYSIKIKTWYSYGYGYSFYDIELSVYLKNYGYILLNNKETSLYHDLIK